MRILDMHCDTIERLYHRESKGLEDDLRSNRGQLDLTKMQAGDYLLQNFAVFVDKKRRKKVQSDSSLSVNETAHMEYEDCFEAANHMIDLYYQELGKNCDWIAPVFRYQDIADNQKRGKMSALLTIEGGEAIKGQVSFLRQFYRLGVRLMTLTWNYENELGAPNLILGKDGLPDFSKRNPKGLTEKGIEIIEEMERLGMIIDVSHLSDGGFYDVVRFTKKPFVASHSNAAAVCNVCRNLTDDMIRILGQRGGVMGLNFCASFLQETGNSGKAESRIADMVRHVKHIVSVGGIEVCVLGTDFDGIPCCEDIPDASEIQRLAGALEKEGFTADEVEKICYKNALRVYKERLR